MKQINTKPFWKEKSLKAVWYRLNDGAKIMLYGVLYLIFNIIVQRLYGDMAALWVLAYGVGFSCGIIYRTLSLPYEDK